MVASVDTSHDAFVRARWAVIGFAVGATGLALVLGFAISWSLVGAVTRMDAGLAQIASGTSPGASTSRTATSWGRSPPT
jgi:hypothetical protein